MWRGLSPAMELLLQIEFRMMAGEEKLSLVGKKRFLDKKFWEARDGDGVCLTEEIIVFSNG